MRGDGGFVCDLVIRTPFVYTRRSARSPNLQSGACQTCGFISRREKAHHQQIGNLISPPTDCPLIDVKVNEKEYMECWSKGRLGNAAEAPSRSHIAAKKYMVNVYNMYNMYFLRWAAAGGD